MTLKLGLTILHLVAVAVKYHYILNLFTFSLKDDCEGVASDRGFCPACSAAATAARLCAPLLLACLIHRRRRHSPACSAASRPHAPPSPLLTYVRHCLLACFAAAPAASSRGGGGATRAKGDARWPDRPWWGCLLVPLLRIIPSYLVPF